MSRHTARCACEEPSVFYTGVPGISATDAASDRRRFVLTVEEAPR